MRKASKFEVILPVYRGDSTEFFEEAVESALSNTLSPEKLIVVQDGPVCDSMKARIEKLTRASNMSLLVIPENIGLAGALNLALRTVKQNIVIRADADDINRSDRFAALIDAMDSGFDLVGSYITEIDPLSGAVIGTREVPNEHRDIVKFLPQRNPFNHMSVAYRTEMVMQAGGYPVMPLREDYALWALLAKSGARMKNIADELVTARTGRAMYKRRGGLKYAKGELQFQRFLVEHKISTVSTAAWNGLRRSAVFLLPPRARGLIYEKLLRKKSRT